MFISLSSGLIEQGDRGVNGQVISPSWYPCDTKTVYRLSLNSLTSELYNLKGNSSTNDLDYNNPEEISPALAHNERLQNPFFVVLNQKPLTPPSQTQGLRDNRKSRPLQTKLFDNTDLTAVNSYWSNESLSDTSSIAFKKPKKIDRRKAAGVDMLKSSPYFRSITTPDRANSPKSIDLNRTKDTFRKPRSSFRHQPASIENFQLGSTIPECGPPWLENSVCPLMTNKDPNDGLVRDKWGLKEEEASKNILKVSGEVDDDKAKRIEKTMILKDKFDLRTDCGTTIKGSVQSNLKSSTSVCTKKKTTVAPGAILTSNRNNLVNETQAPPPSFYNDSFPKSYLTDLDSSERPLTLSCTNTPISSRRNLQNDHRSISGFSLNSSIQTAVASERSRIDADSAMKAFKSNSKQFFLTGAALFTIADGSASAITPSGTPALSIVISERQSVSKSPAVSPAYRSSPTVRPDGNCVYLLDQQEEMPPTHTSKARHQLCNDSADVLRSSDLHQVEDDNIAPDHASASLASDHEMLSLFSSKPMRKTSQSPKEREHGHTPEMVTTPPVINSFSAISDSGLKQTVSDPQGNHEKDIDTDSVAESEGSFDTSSGSFTMSHGSGKDPNQLYDAYASNLEK